MKHLIIVLFCLMSLFNYSQEGMSFHSNKKMYLKGNSQLIGNNIISVDDTKPYNGFEEFNDVLKLRYVDIDKDASTFSSSEANLTLPESGVIIKYAALYWSAVYKYDIGQKNIEKKEKGEIFTRKYVYEGNDSRSENVNAIQFKTPRGNYQNLNGTILFDSYKTDMFEDTKPYVCYADVTSMLQNSKTINGTYTVANIKATEGYVSGGAAGGWLLYVIYESEVETPKYFTTYNGFVAIDKTDLNINFKDFKTSEIGEIKTSVLIAALEGDQKFKTDNCLILNAQNKYIPLTNKVRPFNNFFNSSITIDNQVYSDRNPNSSNTLGFDLLKMGVPNTNNTILSNNSTQVDIRFSTKADGYYLFFVAFETEISPIYLEGENNTDNILVFKNESNIEEKVGDSISIGQKEDLESIEKIRKIKSITIPDIPQGYYLVTNVFSVKKNAAHWIKILEEKGHTPNSYINPSNGWEYIYLDINLDPIAIYEKRKALSKFDYFQDIWILKINF